MLIGISGKIGSGKTYLANTVCKNHNNFIRIAFGDFVKCEASTRYGLELDKFYNGKTDSLPEPIEIEGRVAHTYRDVLQLFGTEVARKESTDYWVQQVQEYISSNDGGKHLIIDDVRFPNEADMVKDLGGFLVRLHRYPGWTPPEGADMSHSSETALDDYGKFDLSLIPGHSLALMPFLAITVVQSARLYTRGLAPREVMVR
jgi:hypothetical protein